MVSRFLDLTCETVLAPESSRLHDRSCFETAVASVLRSGVAWAMEPLINKVKSVPIKVVYYTGAGLVTVYAGYKLVKVIVDCGRSYWRVRKLEKAQALPTL